MYFIKLDTFEIKTDYSVFYGTINECPAILYADKNIPDEILIHGKLLFKNDNYHKFQQDGIIALYFPIDKIFINTFRMKIKIISETYEDYKNKIEPYINSISKHNTK